MVAVVLDCKGERIGDVKIFYMRLSNGWVHAEEVFIEECPHQIWWSVNSLIFIECVAIGKA